MQLLVARPLFLSASLLRRRLDTTRLARPTHARIPLPNPVVHKLLIAAAVLYPVGVPFRISVFEDGPVLIGVLEPAEAHGRDAVVLRDADGVAALGELVIGDFLGALLAVGVSAFAEDNLYLEGTHFGRGGVVVIARQSVKWLLLMARRNS